MLIVRVSRVRKNSMRIVAWYQQALTGLEGNKNQCRTGSKESRLDKVTERIVHIKKIGLCSINLLFIPFQIYTFMGPTRGLRNVMSRETLP